jgi:hypothetical protein
VDTREIAVQRTFASFAEYWSIVLTSPSLGESLNAMTLDDVAILKDKVRERLPADGQGCITYSARANAICGRRPPRT